MNGCPWQRKALTLAALLVASAAWGVPCTIDLTPAATLLVPHFSLDTGDCAFEQPTTLVTVVNVAAAPVLAHLTVWTNLAVPVGGFDLYLQGYDEQTIDVNELVCDGTVPSTGPETSPRGKFSLEPVAFPDCSDPVAEPPTPTELASLRAALNGVASPSTGLCAGVNVGRAEGYLTLDVTRRCTHLNPSQTDYQTDVIGFDNVLAGEFQYVDPLQNFAQAFEAVHIEADVKLFAPEDVTFYGRYVTAHAVDFREPLGTAYRTPYELRPGAGDDARTELVVWRDVGAAAAPFSCSHRPAWYPLSLNALVAFPDRDDAGTGGLPAHAALPRATQRVTLIGDEVRLHPASAGAGWLYLNLQHEVGPYLPELRVGQGWVTAIRRLEGRFSGGEHATPLDSACAPTSFPYTSPGRASADPGPIE